MPALAERNRRAWRMIREYNRGEINASHSSSQACSITALSPRRRLKLGKVGEPAGGLGHPRFQVMFYTLHVATIGIPNKVVTTDEFSSRSLQSAIASNCKSTNLHSFCVFGAMNTVSIRRHCFDRGNQNQHKMCRRRAITKKKNHLLMRTSLFAASILACSTQPSTVEAWSPPSSKINSRRCTDEAKLLPFRSAARRPSALLTNFGQSNRECGVRFAVQRHRDSVIRIAMASVIVLLTLSTSVAAASVDTPAMAASASGAAAAASTLPPASMVRPLGTLRVLPTKAEIDICLRLIVASLGGAAVGLERSSSDRPAGVRTMALVSLGAAVFTICSMYGFLSVASDAMGTKVDPSRMASNIVSGVGFLGAGVITNNRQASGVYDRQSSVNGLTTAAAIWVSAAVGVACGAGMYVVGASAAASTIAILRFGRVKNTGIGKRVMSIGTKQKTKNSSTGSATASADAISSVEKADAGLGNAISHTPNENAQPAIVAGDGLASKSKLGREDVMSPGKRAENMFEKKERAKAKSKKAAIDVPMPSSMQGADDVDLAEKKYSVKKTSTTKNDDENGGTRSGKLIDPMLEKYLWGDTAINEGLPIPRHSGSQQSFDLAKKPRQQIEEGQEIVRHGSDDDVGE